MQLDSEITCLTETLKVTEQLKAAQEELGSSRKQFEEQTEMASQQNNEISPLKTQLSQLAASERELMGKRPSTRMRGLLAPLHRQIYKITVEKEVLLKDLCEVKKDLVKAFKNY